MSIKEYIESLRPKPALDCHDKFLFLGIQKSGLHSVWDALDQRIIKVSSKEWTSKWNNYSDKDIKVMFKFTIARNPWDRLVSMYFAFLRKGKPVNSFKEYIKNKLSDSYDRNVFDNRGLFQYPKVIISDYVAKLENISEDWDLICDSVKCNVKFPKLNTTKHDHYSQYYDDESKRIADEFFKHDIRVLGYKF